MFIPYQDCATNQRLWRRMTKSEMVIFSLLLVWGTAMLVVASSGCGGDQHRQADPEIAALAATPEGSTTCVPDSFYVRADVLAQRLEASRDSITAVWAMASLRTLLAAYEKNVVNGWTKPIWVSREMVICFRWRLERIEDLYLFHGIRVDQKAYADLRDRYNAMVNSYANP